MNYLTTVVLSLTLIDIEAQDKKQLAYQDGGDVFDSTGSSHEVVNKELFVCERTISLPLTAGTYKSKEFRNQMPGIVLSESEQTLSGKLGEKKHMTNDNGAGLKVSDNLLPRLCGFNEASTD